MTAKQFNWFTLMRLPSAWLCGVRVKEIDDHKCTTSAKLSWINQNPFRSMFWAVQGMAAELATGALLAKYIELSGKKVSMLVVKNEATFTKKAVGRLHFRCKDGKSVLRAVQNAINTNGTQTLWLEAEGVNEQGEQVSVFRFQWSLKVKN